MKSRYYFLYVCVYVQGEGCHSLGNRQLMSASPTQKSDSTSLNSHHLLPLSPHPECIIRSIPPSMLELLILMFLYFSCSNSHSCCEFRLIKAMSCPESSLSHHFSSSSASYILFNSSSLFSEHCGWRWINVNLSSVCEHTQLLTLSIFDSYESLR